MSDTTVENVVRKRLSDSSEQVRIGSTSITYNSMGNTTSVEPEVGDDRPREPKTKTSSCNDCGTCSKCVNKETEEREITLKYGAKHVTMLFLPVTACMIFVVVSLNVITSYQDNGGAQLLYTPFNEDDSTDSTGTKVWASLANAGIFMGVVVVMTIFLLLLYKYRCYKIMHGWLCLSSLLLLFLMTYIYVSEFIIRFNIVTDYLTLAILLWNFGCVGMMCIHWIGPLRLQQVYLILVCSQMALVFIKYLPEWTTWVLLAFISIWDLIAVLCPFGPLNLLVKTARERDEKMLPALVYSSTIMYPLITMASGTEKNDDEENNLLSSNSSGSPVTTANPTTNTDEIHLRAVTSDLEDAITPVTEIASDQTNKSVPVTKNKKKPKDKADEEEEEEGIKLGLGDFIFYSILVGKASVLGDWNTVIACFVAVLIGLSLTLLLLAIYQKALPALPISLSFGLVFYFCTNLAVRPFYDEISLKQYFI